MIENLIGKSRITEVADTAALLVQVYENGSLKDDTHLAATMVELATSNNQLLDVVNRDKAESELAALDEVCDDKIQAFHYLLQGALYHPATAVKAAAQQLDDVFENYGVKMVRESYGSQSALVKAMLRDFSEPALAPALAAVSGSGELLTELQTAHNQFEQARIAYENSKAQEGHFQNATQLKKPVVELVNNKLVLYLNAMIQVDEPRYGELARRVAQVIADNNQRVNRRRKKPE